MNLPQFTAEQSLLPTIGCYRTNARTVRRSARDADNILPAEIIEVHGCAPGFVQIEHGGSWHCLPRFFAGWFLDPDEGGGMPPVVPPGGGGGGGGGPASEVPADIRAACSLVGGPRGWKYCGGPMAPSCCRACAQLLCQQKKCEETGRCDPAQLNDIKDGECDCCPDTEICEGGLRKGGFFGLFDFSRTEP